MQDKFEPKPHWDEQSEGEQEQAMAGAFLYAKAMQNRRPAAAPDPLAQADSEELEAMSQELKLRQKCQDIAARVMVDELEEELDDEDE